MLFAPKHQAVVKPKLERAAYRDQGPLGASAGPARAPRNHERSQNQKRDDEANAGKSNRRQVGEAELDEQPCRSPNKTEDQPDDARLHLLICTSGEWIGQSGDG